MTWTKPVTHGTTPSPRSRHTATAVGPNMVIFGGVGGGNDIHVLESGLTRKEKRLYVISLSCLATHYPIE